MEAVSPAYKCPRCCVSEHPFISAEGGARSRASMDTEPPVLVCPDCRERESFTVAAGLQPVPIERWPASVDRLLAEDRERYRYRRAERVPGGGVTVIPGQNTR